MTQLVKFMLEDGTTVTVEVDEDEPGVELASRADDLVFSATAKLEPALDTIRSLAHAAVERLRDMARAPDELEVSFGVRLNARAGAVIATGETEGHLQVKMAWKRSS